MVNCKLAADIQRPKGLPDSNDQAYAANSCEPAQGFLFADVVELADTQVSGTCGRDRP